MKVSYSSLEETDRVRFLDALYTAASGLKTRVEMKRFLRDLLTTSERVMLGRRIVIAQMLIEGRSYDKICGELHAGPDTVRRVHRWLSDEHPGYERAIEHLRNVVGRRARGMRGVDTSVLAQLKRKYPLHFLLFPNPKR